MADHQGPEIQVQLDLIARVNILKRFCMLKTVSTGLGWDGSRRTKHTRNQGWKVPVVEVDKERFLKFYSNNLFTKNEHFYHSIHHNHFLINELTSSKDSKFRAIYTRFPTQKKTDSWTRITLSTYNTHRFPALLRLFTILLQKQTYKTTTFSRNFIFAKNSSLFTLTRQFFTYPLSFQMRHVLRT